MPVMHKTDEWRNIADASDQKAGELLADEGYRKVRQGATPTKERQVQKI